MTVGTFDKIAGAAIIFSIVFAIIAATSWDWFPTPGEWGDIARIPNNTKNYIALLLVPTVTLVSMLIRRWYFKNEI